MIRSPRMEERKYGRLTEAEREEISRGAALGEYQCDTAKRLGRNPGTVSRELGRNGGRRGYRAHAAQGRSLRESSSRRSGKRRLLADGPLRDYVHAGLRKKWSPDEIARRMAAEYPSDDSMRISHEAIYQYVYVLPRGALRKELLAALRQERKYRRKAGGKKGKPGETRGKIAEMLSIEERPAEVADRVVPGHWEGDLVVGKNGRSAVGTLVERTTRYLVLVPLRKRHDARSVRIAMARAVRGLPAGLRGTLTYDQGKEMAQHKKFTASTGIRVYFAHPASPWERGTNENTNGLLRQYFPKGTDFSKVPTRELRRVQREMNDRPRAALGFLKPDEAFNSLVALKG